MSCTAAFDDFATGPSPAAARLGLALFMGVVSVLFTLLTLAFLARAQLGDWQPLAGAPWLPLADPWALWVNTAMLLAASAAMSWAHLAAHRGDGRGMRIGLVFGGLLAAGFLLGQLAVWRQLGAAGVLVATNPANSFFYLLTALHGLHLLGGLVAWAATTAGALDGPPDARTRLHVQLCSRYWDFLFILWLALFALITRSQDELATLAALCGLG